MSQLQNTNRTTYVKYKSLEQQCPHGLIEDHPVATEELTKKWNRKNKYFGDMTIKKSAWRSIWIFNVICQHPDCKDKHKCNCNCNCNCKWKNRISYRNFKTAHWNKKHEGEKNISVKVVSFWKMSESDDAMKRDAEYRLVSTDTLEYIAPIEEKEASVNDDDDVKMNILDNDDLNPNNLRDAIQTINLSTDQATINIDTNSYNPIDIHRDVYTDDDYMSDEDDVHSTISYTDDTQPVYLSNHNKNTNKRRLEQRVNPAAKRRRSDDDILFPMTVSESIRMQQMTDMLAQMRQLTIDLRNVRKDFEDTRKEMDENQQQIKEIINRYEQQQKAQNSNAKRNMILNEYDEMDIKFQEIESNNLKQFIANLKQWSLEKIEEGKDDDDRELFLLQCKLCHCAHISDKPARDVFNANNQAIDTQKKRTFGEGQYISSANSEDASFFYKKFIQMRKHCKKNKRHIATLKNMNKDINLCASNIMVKSEVAHQLFSRAEPDILFHKIMTLLHR